MLCCGRAQGLKERLIELMPEKQAALKTLKKEHGKKIVDKVTIDQLVGGARSIKSMLWETSLLDAEEGIRFRGYTIPELQEALPSYSGKQGDEPTPEGLFWLLLTGEVPTKAQADALTAELHSRAKLPAHVEPMIRAFPKGMHPMTQLSSAILALQTESVFAREYAKGTHKSSYWDHTYEDVMNLVARLPEVAALIYRCTYFDGKVAPYDSSTDYSGNFCQMLGFNDPGFHELMRLYIVIHSDHEGGNASAVRRRSFHLALPAPPRRPARSPVAPPRPTPHDGCVVCARSTRAISSGRRFRIRTCRSPPPWARSRARCTAWPTRRCSGGCLGSRRHSRRRARR